ncbi:hypothetical protein QJ854_gp382 [Moumouvirus goulette]|uniref:Uncharacterized protein n=1 Tax=Moumouvirus goulette TaxID=1247379 RepID=M1NMX5_9VIRU|nr:hypothetical protein QJ854_gp382 [Moumouvirus goulette]AGF85400.1 hypothetical protein glt_00591 [Moumouvirus goulette]
MSSINMLFYSNNCEGSKLLLAMFQTESLTRFFHLICTDNNPKLPPHIKVTPTIIIHGIPTPYVAGDAFAWLAKIKQYKYIISMQKMGQAQQQYLQNITGNINDNNILGFSEVEMNGMSDIFSFFSKNLAQECQDALPQVFVNYNNLGKEKIFTPPLEDGKYRITKDSKCKLDAKRQKDLYTKLELDRKKQDKIFEQSIENFKQQFNKN